MPTVAIAAEFLDAFAQIPKAQQKKVRTFTEKFRKDPRSSSINYEKINQAKDPKVRTVRIDQKYRAIVLHPDEGDVYVLVWVDNHDQAMDWASDRSFEINPFTGSLQVISIEQVQQVVAPKKPKDRKKGLLDDSKNDTLLSFGVPEVLLPAVRAIRSQDELHKLAKLLPGEAGEALIWLAEGIPIDEIKEAIAAKPKQVDTTDLKAALEHPDSQRRFVTIQAGEDLATILDAPLDKWRIFLHPSQRKLVARNFNGPARILGGAGTGKTVVAMHRAKYLAETLCTSSKGRILFTTFTANLAKDVEQNLRNLCGGQHKIETVHLHSWAVRFMRTQGVEFNIANNDALDRCWKKALTDAPSEFDAGFLKQEWVQVVQENGIQNRAGYFKVRRTGRGKALTRAQRAGVWGIFERYRQALEESGKLEWPDVIVATRLHLEREKPSLPYRAVCVDEAQDFHAQEWRLIRAIVPPAANDLFIVGDAHQRIYGRKIALRNCGINIQGRSSRLKINYRTTEQIRAWALGILKGVEVDDLDGDRDSSQGYRSLLMGAKPEINEFPNLSKEQAFLGKRLKELLKDRQPESICLVARTNKMIQDDYLPVLREAGIKNTVLEKTETGRGVRLATMHRVKGLEFPVMILAGVNDRALPLRSSSMEGDAAAKAEHETRERSLLFVAATRARDQLVVTCAGKPSSFLRGIED